MPRDHHEIPFHNLTIPRWDWSRIAAHRWFRVTFGSASQPPIVPSAFRPSVSSVDLSVRSSSCSEPSPPYLTPLRREGDLVPSLRGPKPWRRRRRRRLAARCGTAHPPGEPRTSAKARVSALSNRATLSGTAPPALPLRSHAGRKPAPRDSTTATKSAHLRWSARWRTLGDTCCRERFSVEGLVALWAVGVQIPPPTRTVRTPPRSASTSTLRLLGS